MRSDPGAFFSHQAGLTARTRPGPSPAPPLPSPSLLRPGPSLLSVQVATSPEVKKVPSIAGKAAMKLEKLLNEELGSMDQVEGVTRDAAAPESPRRKPRRRSVVRDQIGSARSSFISEDASGRRASILKGNYDTLNDDMKTRSRGIRRIPSLPSEMKPLEPFEPNDPPQSLRNTKLEAAFERARASIDSDMISLPRGGSYIRTPAGPLQFGIPPETIKDCMALKLDLPRYYIVPRMRFNRVTGINVAEFEFPTYFNFFVLRGKVNLILDPSDEIMIRTVFQETLFGPENANHYLDEEHSTPEGKAAMPDLQKELDYFRMNPFSPGELMKIDTLINFVHFDDNGVATIGEDGNHVRIIMQEDEYSINHEGREITRIPDMVTIPSHVHIPSTKSLQKVFDMPQLGVTFLGTSHGFDASGTTTGFILWSGGRGIMVDPPPNSGALMHNEGIPPGLINGIILTHTHADHDAGTFQKILSEGRITVMTTPTVMNSFLRKYSAICDVDIPLLHKLFHFMPVEIDQTMKFNDANFRFFYTLHAIPCMAFELCHQGKTIIYSGDTCYMPERIEAMQKSGVLSEGRAKSLLDFNWDADLILHEAGVPPIHTPTDILSKLPEDVKRRMYCVHVSKKGGMGQPFPFDQGLKIAACGVENSIRLEVESKERSELSEVLDLVGSMDIFRDFPLWKAKQVLQSYQLRNFSAGQVISEQGERSSEFCILRKGRVRMSRKGPQMNGGEEFEKILNIGDYFGEMALVTNDEVRDWTVLCPRVEAITEVELVAFTVYDFKCIIRNSQVHERLVTLSLKRFESSWETLQENSVLKTLTTGQQTQLQSLMFLRQFFSGDMIWKVDEPASFALIVKEGAVMFEGYFDNMPFRTGAFLGDVAVMGGSEGVMKRRQTSLVALEDTEAYIINGEALINFFEYNPGVLLSFLDRRFVE